MRSARAPWPVWLLVSVMGSLAVLHAVLPDPTRFIPGHPLGDGPKHVWSYWHAPITASTWPGTTLLNAPTGGLLLDPMAFPALLLAPVTAVGTPALSANLWVMAMLVLAALGVGRLSLALGADTRGATLAVGLTLLAQPLLAYPVVSGVHERLGVALIPWLAAALVVRARTGRGGWVPALLLAPLALHSGVWAWVGALLLLAALALPRAVSLGRFVSPWGAGLLLLALTFGVSRGWSTGPMSLAPQPGRHGLLGPGGAVVRAATPSSLWWPQTPSFLEEGDLLCRGEFLGLVASGLVVYAWSRRRSRPTLWWAGVLGLLVAWSLGPWPLGRLNPIYALSVWVVPLLGAWPEPGQLTIPAVLLLGAWVGVAWSTVPGSRLRWVLAALLIGERLLALPELHHRTDTRVDPVVAELKAEGSVVTLPRDLPGRRLTPGVPFLEQMVHQEGIAASVFPGVSLWDNWAPIQAGVASDWTAVARCLKRGGLRHVVVRLDVLDTPEPIIAGLVAGGATLQARSEARALLDLGPPTLPPPQMPPFQPQGAAPPPTGWLPPAPLPVGTHTVERQTTECPVDRVSRRG